MLTTFCSLVLAALPLSRMQEASEPKARTTVLHLQDGTVLRTRARERGPDWEVFAKGEWQLVPGELVQRARPEHELLDQAERLERALPKDDLVRRVAYADWLATEGLHVEALTQIERVLGRDPDQADALALLARADLPLDLPARPASMQELDRWFATCARLPLAAREMAVQQLAGAPEIPDLRAALGRELVARTPLRRAFATLALRRLFQGTEPEGLLARAVLDASADVREGAALALRDFHDPAVIAPAVRALGSRHAKVRTNAVEALAGMDYPEAVEPLITRLGTLASGGGNSAPHTYIFNGRQRSYVQDFDVEVAQGSAIADPIINILIEGNVLDVAVVGVDEIEISSERVALRRALGNLTGADPGDTSAAWQRWWRENGAAWRASLEKRPPVTTPGG